MLRRLFALFPDSLQRRLRRARLSHIVHAQPALPGEPEHARLAEWVGPGDIVVDIGANVGYYTAALAERVGPQGRVYAFEPLPEAFEVLSHALAGWDNVILLQMAASDRAGVLGMAVPRFPSGAVNIYEGSVCEEGGTPIHAIPVDVLGLPPVTLVKLDAEGHEVAVLEGMRRTLERDRPVLIVEDSQQARAWLEANGYEVEKQPGSANVVATAAHPPPYGSDGLPNPSSPALHA